MSLLTVHLLQIDAISPLHSIPGYDLILSSHALLVGCFQMLPIISLASANIPVHLWRMEKNFWVVGWVYAVRFLWSWKISLQNGGTTSLPPAGREVTFS